MASSQRAGGLTASSQKKLPKCSPELMKLAIIAVQTFTFYG
jgi:hypothetical protein